MQRIAVLLTCFNRKDKTINALNHLYNALDYLENRLDITIYLTDDGSSDGTSQAVNANFPEAIILQGTGELFWAGGMRNSWNAALKENFDAYLLLNDDTDVFKNMFSDLISTHNYCLENFTDPGIYVGSTMDLSTKKLSYGGWVVKNKFTARSEQLYPNQKEPQECELGNANIMLVHNEVVKKIGILSDKYSHGLADFDYTLMAKKNGIPVLITPNYIGGCKRDKINPYINFPNLKLKERVKLLYSPIGLDFSSNLQYMKRNFPLRLPLVFLAGWFKILFPKTYANKRNL